MSLKAPLEDLQQRYEKAHPAARRVAFTFGASGDLAKQIREGSPVSLFASAAREPSDTLVQAGMLTPTCVLATGSLVLVRRPAIELAQLTWQNLAQDPALTHLALGLTPTVPAGVYAEEALKKLGSMDSLGPKIVRGPNARSVLDMVAHGEADAAIVYATDARDSLGRGDPILVVGPPPANASPLVTYSLGQVRDAVAGASDLAQFFCAPEASDAFLGRGFGPPSR